MSNCKSWVVAEPVRGLQRDQDKVGAWATVTECYLMYPLPCVHNLNAECQYANVMGHPDARHYFRTRGPRRLNPMVAVAVKFAAIASQSAASLSEREAKLALWNSREPHKRVPLFLALYLPPELFAHSGYRNCGIRHIAEPPWARSLMPRNTSSASLARPWTNSSRVYQFCPS